MSLLGDFTRMAAELVEFMERDIYSIVEVEGLRHFKQSFEDEGFTDAGFTEWEERQTEDKRGRDITRYRTNRVGRKGELNKYGRKIADRPILTGHNTGGDKLRNSLHAEWQDGGLIFKTYKPYAERHNEGKDGMPERQYMGPSEDLDENIERKFVKRLDKIFK